MSSVSDVARKVKEDLPDGSRNTRFESWGMNGGVSQHTLKVKGRFKLSALPTRDIA